MAKAKTKPVRQDDAVVAGVVEDAALPPVTPDYRRPLYLATNAATGLVMGASTNSWASALHDAISAGIYQSTNLAWSYNAKDGDEYAGVKLIMGSL